MVTSAARKDFAPRRKRSGTDDGAARPGSAASRVRPGAWPQSLRLHDERGAPDLPSSSTARLSGRRRWCNDAHNRGEESSMGGGRITAAVAALVTLAGAPAAWAAGGGTLRVNVSTTDVQSLDPAIDYEVIGWTIEFATCAKLVNYPDRPGPAGTQLVLEVAAGLPRVSADGRTYTFRVRPNFRFNDGTHVTAASFAHAFDRALAPKMRSPAASFLQDVVGAKAVATHKATRPAGVTASGSTLRIRLTRAAPDFLARMAMNFFCAIPVNLPINANGVDKPPMAGPYYVASREPGRTITLKRNPYYGGSRPHHLAEIDFTMNTDQHQSLLQVEKGEADYDVFGVPPTSVRGLAQKYGVNKGRFFAHPGKN